MRHAVMKSFSAHCCHLDIELAQICILIVQAKVLKMTILVPSQHVVSTISGAVVGRYSNVLECSQMF